MTKLEKINLNNGCSSVSICRRIFIMEDFRSYSLYVYSYCMGELVTDIVLDFDNENDLNNHFEKYLNSYLLKGFE